MSKRTSSQADIAADKSAPANTAAGGQKKIATVQSVTLHTARSAQQKNNSFHYESFAFNFLKVVGKVLSYDVMDLPAISDEEEGCTVVKIVIEELQSTNENDNNKSIDMDVDTNNNDDANGFVSGTTSNNISDQEVDTGNNPSSPSSSSSSKNKISSSSKFTVRVADVDMPNMIWLRKDPLSVGEVIKVIGNLTNSGNERSLNPMKMYRLDLSTPQGKAEADAHILEVALCDQIRSKGSSNMLLRNLIGSKKIKLFHDVDENESSIVNSTSVASSSSTKKTGLSQVQIKIRIRECVINYKTTNPDSANTGMLIEDICKSLDGIVSSDLVKSTVDSLIEDGDAYPTIDDQHITII